VPIEPALTRWVQERKRLTDVAAFLEDAGVSADRILTNTTQAIPTGQLADLIEELRGIVTSFRTTARQDSEATASLELGKALAASGQWAEAAHHFSAYIVRHPDDWEVHFLRGVALANTRGDHSAQISALRAYGEAIALRPDWLDPNLDARLHTYRGAMLKRLGRLFEAESEVTLGLRLASSEYELQDAHYNLACIYALSGHRTPMLESLSELRDPMKQVVLGSPYFETYWDDPDFLRIVDNRI
jgi:tetratricopeptide (TPR) repeat protein